MASGSFKLQQVQVTITNFFFLKKIVKITKTKQKTIFVFFQVIEVMFRFTSKNMAICSLLASDGH